MIINKSKIILYLYYLIASSFVCHLFIKIYDITYYYNYLKVMIFLSIILIIIIQTRKIPLIILILISISIVNFFIILISLLDKKIEMYNYFYTIVFITLSILVTKISTTKDIEQFLFIMCILILSIFILEYLYRYLNHIVFWVDYINEVVRKHVQPYCTSLGCKLVGINSYSGQNAAIFFSLFICTKRPLYLFVSLAGIILSASATYLITTILFLILRSNKKLLLILFGTMLIIYFENKFGFFKNKFYGFLLPLSEGVNQTIYNLEYYRASGFYFYEIFLFSLIIYFSYYKFSINIYFLLFVTHFHYRELIAVGSCFPIGISIGILLKNHFTEYTIKKYSFQKYTKSIIDFSKIFVIQKT